MIFGIAGAGLRISSGSGWRGHYSNGPCLGSMPLHSGFVFRSAFLERLATASDLQELLPPAAADASTFADGFEVVAVVLLNVPKDRSDFFRTAVELTLCFGELALRLGFKRSDLIGDFVWIEIRDDVVHRLRPRCCCLGSASTRRPALSFT